MLQRNYRSHALLLQVPNTSFYDGALQACGDREITDCRLQWHGLPTRGVPIYWHGVEGKEDREGNSPSWFNGNEAVCVLQHLQSLMQMQPDCKPEHIGIIAAYNKQVHKIMRLLKMHDLGGIKVGSTKER
jgi:superfamily I DNA and/or RNA helicase